MGISEWANERAKGVDGLGLLVFKLHAALIGAVIGAFASGFVKQYLVLFIVLFVLTGAWVGTKMFRRPS